MKIVKRRLMSIIAMILLGTLVCGTVAFSGCAKKGGKEKEKETTMEDVMESATLIEISVDTTAKHQTMEGFGASGAWWSQMVGGWVKEQKNGMETREYIAQLLFDPVNGIGLDTYRYNLGAGSNEEDTKGEIGDTWRRAENFLNEAGEYDFTKDANAVWFMNRAVELGASEVVMFANSPIVTLTKNGLAHCSTEGVTNLAPENYEAFADYFLDVVEHFVVDQKLPIKFISPINEPQWGWLNGQEGCSYKPAEVVALLKVFIDKLAERPALEGIEISAPESGEWGNTNYNYVNAIMADEQLKSYFTSLDCHSYWSDSSSKTSFKKFLENNEIDVILRASEWCEMVNGTDFTMDSAINLSDQMMEDLKILDVVSWQYWIAVSCYNYRDGLIYVTTSNEVVVPTKRLWAMGNYSKYVHEGYVRIDANVQAPSTNAIAFEGNNGTNDEIVLIVSNDAKLPKKFSVASVAGSGDVKVIVTDEDHNLEDITAERLVDGEVLLGAESITTIVISK